MLRKFYDYDSKEFWVSRFLKLAFSISSNAESATSALQNFKEIRLEELHNLCDEIPGWKSNP